MLKMNYFELVLSATDLMEVIKFINTVCDLKGFLVEFLTTGGAILRLRFLFCLYRMLFLSLCYGVLLDAKKKRH